MSKTVTITTNTIASQLNQWHLTNHGSTQEFKVSSSITKGETPFDKQGFESSLKKASRKISAPVPKTKETLKGISD